MLALDLAQTVVVFDLDDTLYFEEDYVESGIRYVCDQIRVLMTIDPYPNVRLAREHGQMDWIDVVRKSANLPISAKESLLWMYRLHQPDIALSVECTLVLQEVRKRAMAVAILTDGRSITQRLKLKSLNIDNWPIYISEDYGSEKPSPERFLAIQARYSALNYVYVGDNVEKDFLGCNPLGWISIWLQGGTRNVHAQKTENLSFEAQPMYRATNWKDVGNFLYGMDRC